MHTTTEFTFSMYASVSEHTGRSLLHLRVETVREFSSFGYVITLNDHSVPSKAHFEVEIGGIELPTNTQHANGPAIGECSWSMPADGTYTLSIRRRKDSSSLTFEIRNAVPQITS